MPVIVETIYTNALGGYTGQIDIGNYIPPNCIAIIPVGAGQRGDANRGGVLYASGSSLLSTIWHINAQYSSTFIASFIFVLKG